MKKIIVLLCTFAIIPFVLSQNLSIEWVKQFGGESNDDGDFIAFDDSANVYVAGDFVGTGDFNPDKGKTILTSKHRGASDIFLSKFNSKGEFKWSYKLGRSFPFSMSADAYGNTYIVTGYRDTTELYLGKDKLVLIPKGRSDIFILKINTSGHLLWTKQIGGQLEDRGFRISTPDKSGNICVTGVFKGSVDFGSMAGKSNLVSLGEFDVFIAELNSFGDVLWVSQVKGASRDQLMSIESDNAGNVYSTGTFDDTLFVDGEVKLISKYTQNVYVSKYDSVGNLVWINQINNTYNIYSHSITPDDSGNVYVTGRFRGTLYADQERIVFQTADTYNIFISKFNAAGELIWVKKISTSSLGNQRIATCLDANNNIYIVGGMYEKTDFDPGVNKQWAYRMGRVDGFIVTLDPSGNFLWFAQMGGYDKQESVCVCASVKIDKNNFIYVTGSFRGSVNFAPFIKQKNMKAKGRTDVFVFKGHLSK